MASIGPPALGAKGCVERLHPTGETTHYDLCVAGAPANHVRCASLRSGGRRLAVRTAMEHPIGALPCTPFASSRRSPQGETRSMERKNRESYISCTIPQFPPLVVNAVSQSPECLTCYMTQKANPVTLTLYSSPPKGETTHYILRVASAPSKCVRCAPQGRYHNPRPEGPSNLRTLRPIGPVNPENLPPMNPYSCPLNPGLGAAHTAAPLF